MLSALFSSSQVPVRSTPTVLPAVTLGRPHWIAGGKLEVSAQIVLQWLLSTCRCLVPSGRRRSWPVDLGSEVGCDSHFRAIRSNSVSIGFERFSGRSPWANATRRRRPRGRCGRTSAKPPRSGCPNRSWRCTSRHGEEVSKLPVGVQAKWKCLKDILRTTSGIFLWNRTMASQAVLR